MDTCAEDRSLIGCSAWEAGVVLCGHDWRRRDHTKQIPDCCIPVSEWELEEYGSVIRPAVFWDTAYTNSDKQQARLERTFKYINGYWKLEVMVHDNWADRSPTRALKRGVLLMADKTMHSSCYSALIDFAKLCAGCQCCGRHMQLRTGDGCRQEPPTPEEDPYDTWGRGCKCECRSRFRQVNELFRDGDTEEDVCDVRERENRIYRWF
jgi:hypothetical protein